MKPDNDTDKSKNTNPVWPRPADRQRLEHLCQLETRSMVDQLSVIIAEAFERRGLDLRTFKPVKQDAKHRASAQDLG